MFLPKATFGFVDVQYVGVNKPGSSASAAIEHLSSTKIVVGAAVCRRGCSKSIYERRYHERRQASEITLVIPIPLNGNTVVVRPLVLDFLRDNRVMSCRTSRMFSSRGVSEAEQLLVDHMNYPRLVTHNHNQ